MNIKRALKFLSLLTSEIFLLKLDTKYLFETLHLSTTRERVTNNNNAHRFIKVPMTLCKLLGCAALAISTAQASNSNNPGIQEPVLSSLTGIDVRYPHTNQATGGMLNNIVGNVVQVAARNTVSALGHAINNDNSPNDDMETALMALSAAAKEGRRADMLVAANDLMNILQGATQGRIYDGFAMLNYNRGAFMPDHVEGEYKMKVARDTGETEPGMSDTGATVQRRIWEISVNLLYYDGQIDSDTFLVKFTKDVHKFDTLRVNYVIYSTEREDFSPTVVLMDNRPDGSVQFPHKGEDSVWVPFSGGVVTRLTVAYPPNRLMRGVYTWGWRVHPPRIQFLQPIWEHMNFHTGEVELEPQGLSYAYRNRQLSIDGIGDAAPEKKMYRVAKAVLEGASPATIADWLNKPDKGPRGTLSEWADLAKNQRQLPPEALNILAQEGIPAGSFGPYQMVTVYMNNEMYGDGPNGSKIKGWNQGDRFQVKLINLDNHTHYFRNVDFGPRLHDDIRNCCVAGSHSFEIMNFKGTYGIPKVAESQWRVGWGFHPHFDVIQQDDTFPRPEDQVKLKPFTDGKGQTHQGFQWSTAARGGDFRFNPPPFIIGSVAHPSAFRLKDEDGLPGILLGQLTEGTGVAKMCKGDPLGAFCTSDVSAFNPNGVFNFPEPNNPVVPKTELRFPPFLRNPNPIAGGDILPPTPAWKPFLWLSPKNGTLFIDANDESKGYWADLTYAHGTPIQALGSLTANIEAPRASGQVFYQFDDLFHDNDIFSPHPTFGNDAIK